MKGVIFAGAGEAPKVTDDLEKPKPNDDQVLVKSLWTAINPVDAFMANYGLLVLSWPLVIGVDAGGIVVSAGSTASSKHNLTPGTHVFGCTRLGSLSYSTGQKFYLMDASLAVPKPANISVADSTTLGVATYTASLALFHGLAIPLPDPHSLPAPGSKSESIVVLGGASSVGRAAIQIAVACGYKVIASCSPASADTIKALGATPFSYKDPVAAQISSIQNLAEGRVGRVFDAVASANPEVARELFNSDSSGGEKYFTTTNDWDPIEEVGKGVRLDKIMLGPVGRADAGELNGRIASYVPVIYELVKQGKVKPGEYTQVGGDGKGDVWQDLVEAYQFQQAGKGGSKKVVVKIADE